MKHSAGFVTLALTAVLFGGASNLHAFTLGELLGTAVVGRALDVSVQVQHGPTEDLTASCFNAEVFHAEARQVAPLVSIVSTVAGDTLVRVRSTALVDEPVVSLELQSRCGSATTRRYVLLADIAPVTVALPLASASPTPAPTPATPAILDAPAVPAPPSHVVAAPKKLQKATAAAVQTGSDQSKQTSKKQTGKNVGRSGSKAVLKLDPMDLFSDRIAALDASMMFEPTTDALQQARKVADLQNDVTLLRELAAKNDAQLLNLKAQLQQAQSQQISTIWFYALAGAAMSGLVALAWLIWQQRRGKQAPAQAWHDSLQLPVAVVPVTAPLPAAEPTLAPCAPTPPEPEPTAPLDARWYAVAPVDLQPPEPVQEKKASTNPASGIAGLHSFSVEPILDIRQQAEFFVSLGQTDRALHILMQQIAASSEPNPFIYLDLLALFHSLGMKPEFRQYRNDFNQHFSGAMPDFAMFHLEGRDLLDYPDLLERLVQGWPSAKTLVLLNAWIFRNPRATSHVSFDLAAFRDLLMLHAMAEELAPDLPWGTASRPWQPPPDSAAKPDAPASAVAPATDPAPAMPPEPPPDINAQVLDMDFSMFDSGAFDLDPDPQPRPAAESAVLPRTDSARWPTKDRP